MTNQEIAQNIIDRKIQSGFVQTLVVLDLKLPKSDEKEILEILEKENN